MANENTPIVLIVDDEPKVFNALRRTLRREDFTTLYANNGEEAERVLAENDVDVALVDMHMPGMQGTQLLARMRQQWPNTVRMMLTGDTRLDIVVKAVNHGEVFRFFLKPVDEAELIVSIRDALQVKALKQESRRLLDTVKEQGAQLRQLGGDTPRPAPKPMASPVISLDPNDSSTGTIKLGSGKTETDDLDLDALLGEIRTELDKRA